MSELVRDDVSTESICTVIENSTGKPEILQLEEEETDDCNSPLNNRNYTHREKLNGHQPTATQNRKSLESTEDEDVPNSSFNNSTEDSCDTTSERPLQSEAESVSSQTRTKIKKSVSFDPNDEKVRKFIAGEPIVDQQNPFKTICSNGNGVGKKKRTPPPVPTKRSTLSVRKTVTQQLREREREKEKERERLKNETNNRKTHVINGNGVAALSSPDEFVTTEEVLKQSKYVKTYIKNPDPYFVYDPTVLARIKFEELREIADKKPTKKLKLSTLTRERLKDVKNRPTAAASYAKLPFKKCSKPNYPELADIKVKVGTESDGNYFNPAEVSKNAKKFDDRVRKLHIASDDDLDDIDVALTKSESSDEVTANSNHKDTSDQLDLRASTHVMNGDNIEETVPVDGTFTNTISSKEFQQYLDKKGLTLIPKKIPNGAQPMYTNGAPRSHVNHHISFKAPESVHISVDTMDSAKNPNNNKKPSVFQRLLANSIFASRRKTTPKETVPSPRSLYDTKENRAGTTPIKRVVLERQSFHGRPRAGNLLSTAEANYLKSQAERSRKSFASGDDLSLSISSALTNAEYMDGAENQNGNSASLRREREQQTKPIVKPPRRTLSKDRLANSQQARPHEEQLHITRPIIHRVQGAYAPTREELAHAGATTPTDDTYLRRTLERQSLIPKRTTQPADRRQVFGRSSSMDRNEILKRNASRNLPNRSKSANNTLKVPTKTNSKENLRESFGTQNGPKLTSTPIRNADAIHSLPVAVETARKTFVPVTRPPAGVVIDPQEWERLRSIKERTDRELYYRMLQQQLQQQQQQPQRPDGENIYEHLPIEKLNAAASANQPTQLRQQPTRVEVANFARGSPQRNTFSGVIRNRQAKIIDGKALLAPEQPQAGVSSTNSTEPTARSQSVLDGMTLGQRAAYRRGYESDSETPVVLRRKNMHVAAAGTQEEEEQPRRIGGILTREEIMQKVKEFCRKSLNKTPTNQPQIQLIYEKQPGSTDLSPVSYASVETHQRPVSRMYAAPQVPQRMQSLPQPQQFIPITHEVLLSEQNGNNASPIYAHVVKRSSLQSNPSELYDSPQRPPYTIVRRESDAQSIYARRATLQRPESALAPATQYVIVDGDKLIPAQVLPYYPADMYAQPQYIRPHQLQHMPGSYGYITVREPMLQHQPLQHLQPQRLHDGRSTPLILDRSSQQASQIYWTPQHQRLQQHAGLLPIEISPRYTLKQPYPVQAPRIEEMKRASRVANPVLQQQQQQQQQQQFSTLVRSTPSKQLRTPSKQLQYTTAMTHPQHSEYSEWESGSEAGEVQRIMEHQRNSGELKTRSIFRNLKTRMYKLVAYNKR